jgi:ATP-binding cassette subfamily B protein
LFNLIFFFLECFFGGKDLSGGQWQRVAIARALYKTHNVIILDEPTSAIDPIEESRLYQNFSKLSHNKTSIIVTHRVGAAQIADLIIVMADGKIAETGTHQSLIQKNGIYAKLFHEQAKWYVHKY